MHGGWKQQAAERERDRKKALEAAQKSKVRRPSSRARADTLMRTHVRASHTPPLLCYPPLLDTVPVPPAGRRASTPHRGTGRGRRGSPRTASCRCPRARAPGFARSSSSRSVGDQHKRHPNKPRTHPQKTPIHTLRSSPLAPTGRAKAAVQAMGLRQRAREGGSACDGSRSRSPPPYLRADGGLRAAGGCGSL